MLYLILGCFAIALMLIGWLGRVKCGFEEGFFYGIVNMFGGRRILRLFGDERCNPKETKWLILMVVGALLMWAVLKPFQAEAYKLDHPGQLSDSELAQLSSKIEQLRQKHLEFENQIATETKNLITTYRELAEAKKHLSSPEAISRFNQQAAAYKSRTENLRQMKADLTQSRQDLEILLAKRSVQATLYEATLYGASYSEETGWASNYLSTHKIPFREVDIRQSPEGAAEFRKLGGHAIPLLVVNGEKMTGWNPAWVEEHLHHGS